MGWRGRSSSLKGRSFRCAAQFFVLVIPRRLQPPRDLPFGFLGGLLLPGKGSPKRVPQRLKPGHHEFLCGTPEGVPLQRTYAMPAIFDTFKLRAEAVSAEVHRFPHKSEALAFIVEYLQKQSPYSSDPLTPYESSRNKLSNQ